MQVDRMPILGKIIRFNRFTAPNTWDLNGRYLEIFFREREVYLNGCLKVRGYLTWETLCRSLGIETTPEEIEQMRVLRKEECPNGFSICRMQSADGNEWILHLEVNHG